MRKREAIYTATGFNVTAAIESTKPDEEEETVESPAATRRVKKDIESATPARRTESKYKVVVPNKE